MGKGKKLFTVRFLETYNFIIFRSSFGDHKVPWCLQSVSKPLTYGIAIHERGEEFVHSYVGQEPSGRLFNEICLNHNGTLTVFL